MTKDEQETTVNVVRSDELARFYTTDPRYIRRIQKDDRFTIEREQFDEGVLIAIHATIPATLYSPLSGIKRRSKPMTPEQRLAAAERLQRALKR